MVETEFDYLAHYGIIRRSGRYPWGSGGNASGFLGDVAKLRDEGLSDKEIAETAGFSINEFRARIAIARADKKAEDVAMAQRLKDKAMSNVAIAERMGLPSESSVRALLAPGALDRANKLHSTAEMLKQQVKEKTLVDVGEGVDSQLGISKEHLRDAIALLEANGDATLHQVPSQQVTNGQVTKHKVLCPHDMTQYDAFMRRGEIQQINNITSEDHGASYSEYKTALVIDPKRVGVNYGPDGGAKADGVIYVRPGVKDVELGNNIYAQVRVQVGPDHYLKGMAVYKEDLPPGVDLVFNTNKDRPESGNKLEVMKPFKRDKEGNIADPELPFGSVINSQILDRPGHPDAKPTSVMNIVNDQGDWAEWSKTIASQMLSKQNHKLIREQLDMTFERRKLEHEELKSLTNPTVKKKLLEEFADSTDSASVHLKAAQLDRSSWHVILPIPSLKPTEIFAPNFNDGEEVALIRYPHGGVFEIPLLRVNNKNREARKMIGPLSADAVGIHHSVASRLSGADFDGDTVLVIPNDRRVNKIKTKPPLDALKDFDPGRKYPGYEGMPVMKNTQMEMGKISNLITDMTIKGASDDKIARAVKHSMVVIDAEKHKLNYRLSEQENGIAALKAEFQGKSNAGASTLISLARQKVYVDREKARLHALGGPIDPITGEKKTQPTGEFYIDKKGNKVYKQMKVERLARTSDAHTLSSGTPPEIMYADHSNRLKQMANQARLDALRVETPKRSSSAAKVYASEVTTLDAKLKEYHDNKPRERQANLVANQMIKARMEANPDMDKSTLKKVKAQCLRNARRRLQVERIEIEITPREWEAIQAGAISNSKLSMILKRAKGDEVRKYATPKSAKLMTNIKEQRAKAMLASGYTRAEVAAALGVSLSTLDNATSGRDNGGA